MRTLLTPVLLDFLKAEGYNYCLSKTLCINSADAGIAITLTPVKNAALTQQLHSEFDNYYLIEKEPTQLANGSDTTIVMVEIDYHQLPQYINFFMKRLAS